MMMRAQFARADLQRAFDDYAELNGREAAFAVLADTTGTRELAAVPEHRIIVAMVALIGGLSFGRSAGKMAAKASLRAVHDALNGLAHNIYARRRDGRC